MQKKNKSKVIIDSKIESNSQIKSKNTINLFDNFIEQHSVKLLMLLIILIGLFAFKKYLTLDNLFFFKDIGSDSLNTAYPSMIQYFNLSQESFINKYSFYSGMGDLYATNYPSDPLRYILAVISYQGASLFGSDFNIYSIFIYKFLHYFLFTGIIFYYYLQTISIKKYSSLIGALIISFSGFLVVGSSWDFDSHIFIAVFMLFSFEQLFVKNRWYFFPFAVIYLTDNIFILFLYSIFLFLYSILRYFSQNEYKIKGYFQLLGKIAILGFVGLLMNASTFGTTCLKMFFSPRVAGNASFSSVLGAGQNILDTSNLSSTTIFRFFSSDLLGSGNNFHGWSNYLEAPLFYIGLLTLIVFPQIFIFLNTRKKILFGGFLGFWILTLFFPYLRHAILLFTGDYFRFGFDFFIPFTFLFYAIYSLNEIDKNFKINLPILIGTFVVLMILLFFPYSSIQEDAINSNLRNIIVFVMIIYGYLLFLFSKPQYKTIAQIGIIFVLIFELSYFSYTSYKDRESVSSEEFKLNSGGYNDGSINAVNYLKSVDKSLFFRTEKDYQSGTAIHGSLNDAMAQGYYGTTSYSSLNQINYVRFLEETELIQKGDEGQTRWIKGFRDNPLLQSFASVKYHLSKSENPFFKKVGFDSINTIKGVKILKNNYYLPFGFTYDKYIDFNDFKSLINYKITDVTIVNIKTELSQTIDEITLNSLISKLESIKNVKFNSQLEFQSAIINLLGNGVPNNVYTVVYKSGIDNFKLQVALLNGFVFEKGEFSNYNVSELSKIQLSDSSKLLSMEQFNYVKYKEFTDELKNDTLQITNFKQSNIKGIIELKKTKMLFLSIPFDIGWNIKVDGKKETLSRVNIGFTGIVLPKGKHQIELYFIPQYSQVTSIISIISVILFWLYFGYYFFKKWKIKSIEVNKKTAF